MGLGRARGLEFEQAARANASPVLQGEVYQRCKDAYLSAKAIYPDKPEPIVEFARVEAKRGAIGDALTFLSQAIAERPEDAAYHQEMFDLVLRGDTANRVHWLSTLVAIYEVQFAKLQETSPRFCGMRDTRSAARRRPSANSKITRPPTARTRRRTSSSRRARSAIPTFCRAPRPRVPSCWPARRAVSSSAGASPTRRKS